ncbi:MAG TPA: FG-GAP-like repeat-containing protein, partial [Acidobacteriota bacterium]|nr:FG-GAP-like repeat-containing protein [Acidobacteriota bacterium]
TLQVVDADGDGRLDIFTAEMRLGGENPGAKVRLLFGDGRGRFREQVVAEGIGVHEARMADLDGDGDLDILGKPYNWDTPRVDIWLNTTSR